MQVNPRQLDTKVECILDPDSFKVVIVVIVVIHYMYILIRIVTLSDQSQPRYLIVLPCTCL